MPLNAKLFRERQTFSWTPNFFVNANFFCERKYPEYDFPHSIPLQKRWFGHHPVPSCSARAQIQRSVFGRLHFPVHISLQHRWLVSRHRKHAKTGFREFENLKTQFWERVMFPIMSFYKKRWFGFHIIEHRLFFSSNFEFCGGAQPVLKPQNPVWGKCQFPIQSLAQHLQFWIRNSKN